MNLTIMEEMLTTTAIKDKIKAYEKMIYRYRLNLQGNKEEVVAAAINDIKKKIEILESALMKIKGGGDK